MKRKELLMKLSSESRRLRNKYKRKYRFVKRRVVRKMNNIQIDLEYRAMQKKKFPWIIVVTLYIILVFVCTFTILSVLESPTDTDSDQLRDSFVIGTVHPSTPAILSCPKKMDALVIDNTSATDCVDVKMNGSKRKRKKLLFINYQRYV